MHTWKERVDDWKATVVRTSTSLAWLARIYVQAQQFKLKYWASTKESATLTSSEERG